MTKGSGSCGSKGYSLAIIHPDLAPLHHVHETPRCGHQKVAAPLQLSDLLADVGATVHHTGANTGAVGDLWQGGECQEERSDTRFKYMVRTG